MRVQLTGYSWSEHAHGTSTHIKKQDHYQCSQKPTFHSLPVITTKDSHSPDLWHHRLALPVFEICVHVGIHCVVFNLVSVLSLSLYLSRSTILGRFISPGVRHYGSFTSTAAQHFTERIHCSLFTHSTVDRHLGTSEFGAFQKGMLCTFGYISFGELILVGLSIDIHKV